MRVQGIAASPGLALGPVYRFEREELAVREVELPPEALGPEIERFHSALEISRRELAGIRDGIAAELGEAEAHIYDAHLMMLDDPELLATVEKGIREQGRNAAFVFRAYMSAVAAHFEQVEDEYLRERRSDIVDCARRVLRHLVGASTRQLEELREPAIVVAHDLGPSEVAMLPRDKVLAFVLEVGGRTSHGAIVARGRGIPAVVSVPGALAALRPGLLAAVDGYLGVVETRARTTPRSRSTACAWSAPARAPSPCGRSSWSPRSRATAAGSSWARTSSCPASPTWPPPRAPTASGSFAPSSST